MSFASLIDQNVLLHKADGQRSVIAKEILHYEILAALSMSGLLKNLTFQGGTSLRLIYGAQRLSEDLDFAGGRNFTAEEARQVFQVLKEHLSNRFSGNEVSIKEPKNLDSEALGGVHVNAWQIGVTVNSTPSNRTPPKEKVKLEIASVDALSSEIESLKINHEGLPDGYRDLLLKVQSKDEIMADKLVSFPNAGHLRHRDIWDLLWLKQQGATPNMDYVRAKLKAYDTDGFEDRLRERMDDLPKIVHSEDFDKTLTRFILPEVRVRTLDKPEFRDYLAKEVGRLLQTVQNELEDRPTDPFRI